MKENKYDQIEFFEKYQQMNRSINGLAGAGEWSALKKILPDFKDKKVLDLGCGMGWHCKYASDHGAKEVLGTDISKRMLEKAQQINAAANIKYFHQAMEDLSFANNSFDIVFSSLAFHYVEDFDTLVKNIYSWLNTNGDFIFSVEHPVFTAAGNQDWIYDDNGNIQHFPVDNYYYEGKREAIFLDEKVTKYHRTLTSYLQTLLKYNFTITNVIEPMPPEDMMDLPGMQDEMRRPMMLLVSAKKA
ncbi:bifunctional 2-polyprenyl-6-hydroxyphenol methylase/3-demethylubiquinol 3-O-methyltransferase UbiG [uncultured Thomasclavelia sp.]|uniref:class I SAM-dependent methyltransferase n=1 Tax=uncultured Thomasclavelia sp. TaxID=3025759 RepID=UPI0025E6EEE4|nr:class I SAM-dependent methyltransferase [uncultured Thomasclavelia sp.]